jgi:PHD/YefM family antitoxin component YafN of YafNO toxin-antitoxin module
MLTFKKNTVRRYFTDILNKTNKEPIGVTNRNKITNVIISYEVYQKLLDTYMQLLNIQVPTEKNIEEYLKSKKQDEI